MPSRPRTRVFIITGASDGIGAELALQLAGYGHRLVLAGRNEAALQEIARQCQRDGAKAIAAQADVTVEEDCRRLIDRALEAFGRIDVLVNNAGVSMQARFDEIGDWSAFERLWRVNCLGTIHCTRFAWPHLKARLGKRGGQIVGISALAVRKALAGQTAFCASKSAQAGFLEALRAEAAAHGITVTVVYPGAVATAFRRHELNARGEPSGAGATDDPAMAVDECVRRIVRAIDSGKRELALSTRGGLAVRLKGLVPQWLKIGGRKTPKEQAP